ncbi:MAG: LuxR C-terminal-related transcriptional regulator [Bacteroidales bacterium]|nr:LuxR C-terminal-related transcriptional regulator [Bacteroidales bacterium]
MKLPESLNFLNREFIGIDNQLYRLKVELVHFNEFQSRTLFELQAKLDEDMVAQVSLDTLGISDEKERLHKFGLCRFAGFDDKADINSDSSSTHEYYDCGQRGVCPVEGKLCKHVAAKHGHLTPREIEVIKLIARDLADKQIADSLSISINTAIQHRVNIQKKVGCSTKVGICRFAIEKRII